MEAGERADLNGNGTSKPKYLYISRCNQISNSEYLNCNLKVKYNYTCQISGSRIEKDIDEFAVENPILSVPDQRVVRIKHVML